VVSEQLQVAIVCGGIGGLTAALALRVRGLSATFRSIPESAACRRSSLASSGAPWRRVHLKWINILRLERRDDLVQFRLRSLKSIGLRITVALWIVAGSSFAAEQPSDIPAWLRGHIGDGEGQIAQVVLQRARAFYLRKVAAGVVKNPCYFAMDATRPNDLSDGALGKRFYVICEADRSFRAISAGHGSGRDLMGRADFANRRECAKNFGNALDSNLTAGGAYVTRETKTSFKGYYRASTTQYAVLIRSFVQFEGEGETANARERAIGGHAAVSLKGVCLKRNPHSPYANQNG
jgi:hypothetical protein